MILCHSHKFIFFHNPKTAGTAVMKTLEEYCSDGDVIVDHTYNDHITLPFEVDGKPWVVPNARKHSPVHIMKKRLPPQIWDSYFKFAFVRNPYARTLSAFNFHKRGREGKTRLAEHDFQSWLRSEMFQSDNIVGARGQAKFLSPVADLDFIGHQETLDADMAVIRSRIEGKPLDQVDTGPVEVVNRRANHTAAAWTTLSAEDKESTAKCGAVEFWD